MSKAKSASPARQIEMKPTGWLKAYAKNAVDHPLEQIKTIAQWIDQEQGVGWTNPILALPDGEIIAGHGRLQAALHRGDLEVPVIVLDIDRAKAAAYRIAAYRIADNRLARSAAWNELLGPEIHRIRDDGIDLDALGFSEAELSRLLGEEPEEDEGERSEAPARTKPGDLWALGEHRLLCGDSTNPKDVARVLQGDRPVLVATDPPYGVSYQDQGGKFEAIAGDDLRGDALVAKLLVPAFRLAIDAAAPDAAWYIWHASATAPDFRHAMATVGLVELQTLVWIKPSPVLGRADYQWTHEPCFYAAKEGQKPAWYGGRAQQTVWRCSPRLDGVQAAVIGTGVLLETGDGSQIFVQAGTPKGKKPRRFRLKPGEAIDLQPTSGTAWEIARDHGADHPTQKPSAIFEIPMRNNTLAGAICYEPFSGSGSQIVAGERTGRRVRAIELDPKYCDVAIERWERLTKGQAERRSA